MKANIINLKTGSKMTFCLITVSIFLLIYSITLPVAVMSSNDNGSESHLENATNNHYLYDSCSLKNKIKSHLTIMINNKSSENLHSNSYAVPLSFCIDFGIKLDNFHAFVSENSDRAETGRINLILESNTNVLIVTNSDKNRSTFEVFLGCPIPVPPTYHDQWLLLEFDRDDYDSQKFRIPVITEDIKPLIEKYEFGCSLLIREFTSNNTMSEFRLANTIII